MSNLTIHNKALVVALNVSQWTGRKHDRRATETVETEHKTETAVGNYHKKLLPGAKELSQIQRIVSGLRTFYYERTLPWASDGARIIKSSAYLDFMKEFKAKKTEFDHAVTEFIREYPSLREAARAKLGDLFRETEYPTVSRLEHAFSCDVKVMPVPSVDDFRVEISQSEKDDFLKAMREVEDNAMREAWARLHDVCAKAASVLVGQRDDGKPAIFRDSLIENIRDLCTLLPKLNVMDDPKLEAMRVEVEKLVCGISADDCRKDQDARTHAASALDDIAAKMSAYMGN